MCVCVCIRFRTVSQAGGVVFERRYIHRSSCYKLIWELRQSWSENAFLTVVIASLLICPSCEVSCPPRDIGVDALIEDKAVIRIMHDKTDQAARLVGWSRAARGVCALEQTLRCEAGDAADVPEFPQPVLWGPLESFVSKRVPSAQALLLRCRGEQNQSDQNGYEPAARCVCVTGALHSLLWRGRTLPFFFRNHHLVRVISPNIDLNSSSVKTLVLCRFKMNIMYFSSH